MMASHQSSLPVVASSGKPKPFDQLHDAIRLHIPESSLL
jgi:hypothetical protein